MDANPQKCVTAGKAAARVRFTQHQSTHKWRGSRTALALATALPGTPLSSQVAKALKPPPLSNGYLLLPRH